MKVLYISDRRMGGIVNHVKCLTECLPPEVERYVIGEYGDEPFAGKSGHSIREWFQIRRVIKRFRPDVIHFNTIPLFMALYVKLFWKGGVVCSIHTPSNPKPRFSRRLVNWAVQPCYWLPVSDANWKRFKAYHPGVKGEVFYNPIKIARSDWVFGRRDQGKEGESNDQAIKQSNNFIVGMVGRNADVKDWPSFHRVEDKVKGRGEGEQWSVEFLNAGEKEECDGRAAIAKMDLFVMTSKSEELPTTVLECFMLGTPICGFIPVGGTSDILGFSKGPVRAAFISERDCDKLADIVMDLLSHPEKRQALVEDGRQILENHFDAEKNVRGQLMEIYKKVEGRDG